MAAAKAILGTTETHPDILWASGFHAHDPMLYVDIGGKRYVFANALEFTRAKSESRVEVLSFEEYANAGGASAKDVDAYVRALHALLQEHAVKQLTVPETFPLAQGLELGELGYEIETVSGALYPERSRKTQEEIGYIQEVVKRTEEAITLARDMMERSTIGEEGALVFEGSPLTSERLKEVMAVELLKHEVLAVDTIVAVGEQALQPHNRGTGVLRENEFIVIDIFPRSTKTGYFADITRTFLKGKPSRRQRSVYEAVREAQAAGEKVIRAGVAANEPHDAAARVLEQHGFTTTLTGETREGFIHGLGHGMGLEVHEPPRMNASAKQPLEVGNVVSVEPGLYYKDIGGIRLEDDVVVTEGGCENLCSFPKDDDTWVVS